MDSRSPEAGISAALRYLSPDCDRHTWVVLGMAVKSALGDAGFPLWDAWSQGSNKYRAGDAKAAWRGFKPGSGGNDAVGIGTLYHLARAAGWEPQGGALPAPPAPMPRPDADAEQRALDAQHAAIARKASAIWRHAYLAQEHAYLRRKGIQPHGAKLFKDALVIPLYASPDALVNLQFIQPDGAKRFLKGGRKSGCFWWIGKDVADTVCLAEGFATAASVYQESGFRCYIAFDAGNLPHVGETVRGLHPRQRVVICGDHDPAGIRYANLAALRIGADVAFPDQPGQDFNDMARGEHGRA